MPKTKPKPKVAKKVAKKVAAKRHHAPILHHRRVAKKTAPRKREPQTPKKESKPMMTPAAEQSDKPMAMSDRRKALLEQAAKNEAANDELNAIQVEQIDKVQKIFAEAATLPDPDEQRETAVAALRAQDPDERKKRAEADAKAAKPKSSPTTADFKQGQAAG